MHGEIKTPPFSREARLEAGFLLRKLQLGDSLSLPQSRPLLVIGKLDAIMEKNEKDLLNRKGWKVGSTEEFLDLSEEELAYIELKISLSRLTKQLRVKRQLTQQQTADLISSSQSRVAKIEAGDPSVSVDLQIRSLLALGASKEDLAEAIMS